MQNKMYYKIKLTRPFSDTCDKRIIETYLTEGTNFAEAAEKVINEVGTAPEIEDILLMKNFKPAVNEPYDTNNKVFIVKIAEDILQDNGTIKTLKYVLPAFANNNDELQKIMTDYISQGLNGMRLTTISETKWVYI